MTQTLDDRAKELREWFASLDDATREEVSAEWVELVRRAALCDEIPPLDQCALVQPELNPLGRTGLQVVATSLAYFVDDETEDGLLRARTEFDDDDGTTPDGPDEASAALN